MKYLRTALLIAMISCVGCVTTGEIINKDYVDADRATFDAITPEYLNYVNNDPTLDDDERRRRSRTVSSWRLRLEQAERPVTTDGTAPVGSE